MSEVVFGRLFNWAYVVCALIIISAVLFALVWPPLVYDSIHFDDLLFLANLGWRSHTGAVPTVDFNHFLGGVTAFFVGLSFSIFGASAKAIEYAALLQAVAVLALLWVVAWRRVSMLPAALLAVLVVVLMLTRAPLEISNGIAHVHSAHSFLYNRLGTCIAIVLSVYAIADSRSRRQDAAVGVVCGVALYVLFLTKPTFIVFGPTYLLALAIMGRWTAIAAGLAGVGISLLAVDLGGGRLIAAFDYAQAQMSDRVDPLDLVRKILKLLVLQTAAVVVAGAVILIGFAEAGARFVRPMLAIAVLVGGQMGMCATMGASNMVGHQALPFLAVVPLLVFLALRESVPSLGVVALVFPACLIVPHAGNMVGSSFRALQADNLALIESGPLSDYVAYDWAFLSAVSEMGSSSREAIESVAEDFLEEAELIDSGVEYVVFAEGIRELEQISNVESLGIVTNGRMYDFSFALQSPPVLSYPAFPESTSPELRSPVPLGSEVDIVMIAPFENHGMVTDELIAKMTDLYAVCRTSRHWRMYARIESDIEGCTKPGASGTIAHNQKK